MRAQFTIVTIAAGFMLVVLGCTKEEQLIRISNVQSELIPYFRTFEHEAQARGVLIDASFSEIEARIVAINDGNVIGRCRYNSHHPNAINIDRSYWERASELDREMVVFHELGHCYLDRGHTERTTSSGICLSLMASGTGDCWLQYVESTREYYLDELFSGLE